MKRNLILRRLTRVLLALGIAVPCVAAQSARAARDARPLVVSPEQDDAVQRGLEWLASQQIRTGPERGSWPAKIGYKLNEDYRVTAEDVGHVGVTSLACMAYLAGGNLPGRGTWGAEVERGLSYVLSCANDDGYITRNGTRMYSHAFATLFLAEIYGMTHRDDVRRKLQRAIDFIVDTQNEEGGWRYVPFAPDSDMSIVVCQVLALRAARNIGIRVPRATIDRAARYIVDSAIQEPTRPTFRSSLLADEIGAFHYQRGVYSRSSFPLTAAGVTALHGVGIYSDEKIGRGLDYLRTHLEAFNHDYGRIGHYFFWYGHYYGVQAMYTAGSSYDRNYWEPYFEEVRATLLNLQDGDGSWPNRVGPGPAFSTAMAVLILEIPYRYLPIFQR
ncbi:MAG TPA: prenyltransferase [Planctomycetes bacterium]|nr:prenyltransferase [Planctomycetota bacterium]